MWRLGLGGDGGGEGDTARLPERPREADCDYYLRTGTCGFGERCRYNHPRDRGGTEFGGGAKNAAASNYPERLGQPACEYYMKTGTCKFGSSCKYHHPQPDGPVQHVMLNNGGFPLRPGEKECSYYMKTGQCKFGSTCKFHHPEFGGVQVTPGIYPPLQSSSVPSPHLYAPLANWQMGRPPAPVVPGSYMPGSYTPMMFSSGMIPLQGWSPYHASVNPVASGGAQQNVQAGPVYGIGHHGSSSTIAYGSPYIHYSSSNGQSSNNQQEDGFPERPGQPECQYYMRTGDCKFGATCKYNHPRDWSAPKSNYVSSPLCLPLRPGAQPCAYYAQNGYCRYGVACKYDHPMGTLSYSSPAFPKKKGREKFDLSLDSLSRGRGENDAAAAHHKPKLFFLVGRMEFERKPLSLLELCIRTVIDNLRYVGSVDGVELQLLKRILPHCTLDQLTRIESRTEMDLSPVTDVLWKRFYQRQFGEENMNHVVKKMKQSGVHYKWKDLFKAKTEKQKEIEDKMVEKLTKKYQAEKAEKQSKQIKLCTKVPPSSKRSFFGGSGPSNLSNYKSPMLKKARMEVNSRAKMQSAIQRNNLARSSQPTRMTSPHGQPMRTTTIHRPNSTITITKPTSSNRPIQNSRLKF